MSDIFLSYASADREKAQSLAQVLSDKGWSVWWDRTIPPGKVFDQVIEEALSSAGCVVVLWSEASVSSDWVKTEAADAAKRGILVPAMIESVQIPLEFRRIQAADLSTWVPAADHPEMEQMLRSIGDLIGEPEVPPTPQPEVSRAGKPFEVKIRRNRVVGRPGQTARLAFGVTNVSGRTLRALLKLVPERDEHTAWLRIDGEERRDLEDGQTETVVVSVDVPQEAPAGAGRFRLAVAPEEGADEDLVEATGEFTVAGAAATSGPPPPPLAHRSGRVRPCGDRADRPPRLAPHDSRPICCGHDVR